MFDKFVVSLVSIVDLHLGLKELGDLDIGELVFDVVDLFLVLKVTLDNLVDASFHVIVHGIVVESGEDLAADEGVDFLVFDGEIHVVFHDAVFDELPLEAFLVVGLVVLFYVFGAESALVVFGDPAFKELVGQVERGVVDEAVDHLGEEDAVSLTGVLFFHLFFDGSAEGIEVLDLLVGEDLLEEFLVEFGLLFAADVVDDDVIVAVGRGVVAEHLCSFFSGEDVGEVDDKLRAGFFTDETFFVGLRADVLHGEHHILFLEAIFEFLAVFGFTHLEFEDVVFADGLGVGDVGVAFDDLIDGLVDGGIVSDDVGEIDVDLGVIDVDIGAQGGFEEEVEGVLIVEIKWLLMVGIAERVADEVEIVLKDVVVEGLRDKAVEHLYGGLGAVHLLDHAERHHAWAESRDVGFLLELVELFLDLWFVVVLDHVDLDGDQLFSLVALCCVHYKVLLFDDRVQSLDLLYIAATSADEGTRTLTPFGTRS